MALRSQVARQGIRWRYKPTGSGRGRGRKRWPWAVLSLLILVAVGLFIYNGSTTGAGGTVGAAVADASGTNVDGDADASASMGMGDGLKLPPPGTKGNTSVGSAAAIASRSGSKPTAGPQAGVWTLDGSPVEAADTLPVASNKPLAPPVGSTPVAASTFTNSTPASATSGAAVAGQPVRSASTVPTPIETYRAATGSTASIPLDGATVEAGFSLIEQGHRVEGRKVLSKLLLDGSLTQAQAQKARDVLTIVNNTLIYSPRVYPEEPLTGTHVVVRGDRLVKIAIQYKTPHQFIEKINGINADRIQLEQKLKIVHGPFHAIVSKSAFRMDVYLKDPADGQMLYIRSFPVGLGADDSTPLGSWVVRPRSKVINPGWTNPRTGESYTRDDPKNPVGEFWMGLEGVSAETATLAGYGIHGTIDQASVGTQSSMGCIRLRDEDVSQVYYMFWEGETTVQITR